MPQTIPMHIIARIRSDFPTKFGIPRQSGLADAPARIVFEPEYRNADALRGIEGFSHLWLLWHFSEAEREGWSPTVRPPKLGGNKRMGVFATRSPFRPNAIGLSSVRLNRAELHTPEGPVLHISGADLMDGTPIYDIKPYSPLFDCHPDASGSFTHDAIKHRLSVHCTEEQLAPVPPEKREALLDILALDPRPGYHTDPERVYGMDFGDWCVKFCVENMDLYVKEIVRRKG